MHSADLKHSNDRLQSKLEEVFQLRRTRSKVNWDRSHYLELLEAFGNPHLSLPPVIHVAGTNGKGSVISMLRAILEAQGLKVHCYTSPHLIDINERIYLAGQYIENIYLEQLIDQALAFNNGGHLSFFEIITALAFKAFSEVSADILLLEVGMGGRLDCTNVIDNPLLTIINRISLDHTDFLGANIKKIAAEKAGIMKNGVPCIVGYQGNGDIREDIIDVVNSAAKSSGAVSYIHGEHWDVKREKQYIIFSFRGKSYEFPLPSLHGAHQVQNAGLAIAALFSIKDKLNISYDAIETGIVSAKWRGRLQKISVDSFGISKDCEIWLDSGHNDSAAQALAVQIKEWATQDNMPVHIIMGMLGTKNASMFLDQLLPHIDSLHIVPISSDSNSWSISNIRCALNSEKIKFSIYSHDSFVAAVRDIDSNNNNPYRILIVGSVYLAGEVLKYIET